MGSHHQAPGAGRVQGGHDVGEGGGAEGGAGGEGVEVEGPAQGGQVGHQVLPDGGTARAARGPDHQQGGQQGL